MKFSDALLTASILMAMEWLWVPSYDTGKMKCIHFIYWNINKKWRWEMCIGQKVWYTLDRLTRCQFYSYLWTLELFNPCVFLHERTHANSTQRGPSLLVDLNPGPSRCETTANHWSILLSLLKNDVWISVENVSQSWYNLHASITLTWTGSYFKKMDVLYC